MAEEKGEVIWEASGRSEEETTNNRMELTAMIEALRWAAELREPPRHIKLISDSTYVVEGINSWRHNWKRNGWRKKAKSPYRGQERRSMARNRRARPTCHAV